MPGRVQGVLVFTLVQPGDMGYIETPHDRADRSITTCSDGGYVRASLSPNFGKFPHRSSRDHNPSAGNILRPFLYYYYYYGYCFDFSVEGYWIFFLSLTFGVDGVG